MFSLTSTNIAQTQGHDRSTRLGRRTSASAVVVGAAAIALLAFTHTSANAAENSSQAALEQHACAVVLGLDPSGRRYDTCIRHSIGAWPNRIGRDWFRPVEAHVSRSGSSPARRLSQCAC
jgi:hypothetical protein